jgi:spore germination protein GerM
MTRARAAAVLGLVVTGLAAAWVLFVALPQQYGTRPVAAVTPPASSSAPQEPAAVAKIKATLYYVGADGLSLVGVQREISYGEGPIEQARRIVEEQLEPPPDQYVSAVPSGTRLRALYLTEGGDAFVDLSSEVSTAHPGGSLDEILTVYSIVNALTTNLAGITAVQILIDGKEVDTLAGHVDLRQPLQRNLKWVEGTTP